MVSFLREVADERRADSRKWKGFNRILAANAFVVIAQPLLEIDGAVVSSFLVATGLLYGAYAGANAYTKTKGVEP